MKLVLWLFMFLVCIGITISTYTVNDNNYIIVSDFSSGAITTSYGDIKMSAVIGEVGIGNYTDENNIIRVGILYTPLDLSIGVGTSNANFTIWNGSDWVDPYDNYLEFRCTSTQQKCEPTNQDDGGSQSIYKMCNNGTASGVNVSIYMDEVCPSIDLLCDDDYTYAGAITLSAVPQDIYGVIEIDDCMNISCWADFNSPTSGCYFDIFANITTS